MRSFGAVALAGACVACGPAARGDGDGGNVDASGEPPWTPPPTTYVPQQCRQMDIVFVVDDSGSMGQEQESLKQAFPQFAKVLREYRLASGEALDYRVALTTTGRSVKYRMSGFLGDTRFDEKGDDGAFRTTCGVARRWLEPTDANMETVLACRAKVGTGGPSIEMPMLTTMMALQERIADGTNAGFLRKDALLAIVMITDEDDCSRRDNDFLIETGHEGCAVTPAEFVGALDGLKGGRGRWAAAVVAGPGPGICESNFGTAEEGTRLKEFVSLANGQPSAQNTVFSSICEGNMALSLKKAIDTFQAACETFPPIE